MPRAPRQMRLTADHVRRVHRDIPDPGPSVFTLSGYRIATDDDYAQNVREMIATAPPGGFWIFAYGSLIWRPETAVVDKRLATAHGWHRRFCLGWDYRWRGNTQEPGLMMALDRGGQCRGVIYRLPDATLVGELDKLLRREMVMVPSDFPWRWIDVSTDEGPMRAMTFAMNRKSQRYVANLGDEQLADVLATARGFRGSMAEYLFSTVQKLEELGIHDRNLWRMQALVADRIDAAHPTEH
jgi:glutathione-specific gamma-glutamylcyclotransferase